MPDSGGSVVTPPPSPPAHLFIFLLLPPVLFAPTELKVRAKMHSLHVTWQPPPNNTQISGYKLHCREVELEELANEESPEGEPEKRPGAEPIKLRKKSKHHEVTGLGEPSTVRQAALHP